VNPSGRVRIPGKRKTRSESEFSPRDSEITYSQFEAYDEEMTKLVTALGNIADSVTPITDAAAIERAIRASNNILRFPIRLEEPEA
jgi:hypothetical protein